MNKRLNAISVFKLKSSIGLSTYVVTLERLKNTPYGAPRYKAVIIPNITEDYYSYYNAVYTFTGHYLSEKQEAEYILEEFIKEKLKKQK